MASPIAMFSNASGVSACLARCDVRPLGAVRLASYPGCVGYSPNCRSGAASAQPQSWAWRYKPLRECVTASPLIPPGTQSVRISNWIHRSNRKPADASGRLTGKGNHARQITIGGRGIFAHRRCRDDYTAALGEVCLGARGRAQVSEWPLRKCGGNNEGVQGTMLTRILAVLALAVSFAAITIGPSQAGSESSPWFDTNSNAAGSRANLTEKVLSPTAVPKVKYLRSVVAPPISPKAQCDENVAAPVLVGGYLYVITDGSLSKYNAATGALVWRRIPDPTFGNFYTSLAVSGNLVVLGGSSCLSNSEPPGFLYAYNTSTGALVWSNLGGREIDDAVIATSYVITEGFDAIGSVAQVFNLANGSFVWSTQQGCGSGRTLAVVVALVVMSNGCDAQSNASLEANSLATGALLWSLPGKWGIQRGDLSGSAGKHLYATNPSGRTVALNPLTGQVQYSLNGAGGVLAVDTSRVYASCSSGQIPAVCAYDINTGALDWQTQEYNVLVAEADGVLYLGNGEALNAATGQLITTIWGAPPFASAMAIGDGRIAVVSDPRVLDLYGLPGY